MDLRLTNQVAVVTGGASGIGRAVVEGFAQEQARVALWDLSPRSPQIALELSQVTGVPILGLQVDITKEESVRQAVQNTIRQLGPIDHLVHAAAIGSGKFGFPFTNLTPQDWPRTLEVNILGMVNVAHAVAPGMMERRSGTLSFIASVAGQIGSQTDPPYSASKAANINFAQCMAKDLAPYGVRVNSICPGMVQTPLNRSVWQAWNDQQPAEQKRSYEDWADEKVRKIVPLGRWQTPADVANLIVFLASERAAQITGQTLNVDGGYVIR